MRSSLRGALVKAGRLQLLQAPEGPHHADAAPAGAHLARQVARAGAWPRAPGVVLVIGVNGGGKTTTLGKLAHKFRQQGASVRPAPALAGLRPPLSQSSCWPQPGCTLDKAIAPGSPALQPAHKPMHEGMIRRVKAD